MQALARKLRPAVKWPGGKAYLARRIVALFPEHAVYVEPFAGGASVLLNKPTAGREVLNDLHPELINFYRVLRDQPRALVARLQSLAYTRHTFQAAARSNPNDPMGRAVRFMVTRRMSRGGSGRCFSWATRDRGGQNESLNAWETALDLLPAIAERLAAVELECGPALDVIRRHNGPGTLTYCDPPYLHSTRTHRRSYDHEMSDADHAEMLDALCECRGAVVLSGYPSALYHDRLAGWDQVVIDMPNHANQGRTKPRRAEVLWVKSAE